MIVTDDDPDGDWTVPGVLRCAPDVYRIPLPLPNDGLRAVNVYAVADGSGWTLVDAGWALPQARDLVVEALAALGAGPADVRRFLVTHVHRDHYTQAVALRREFGTRVVLGEGERPNLAIMRDPAWTPGGGQHARLVRAGADALAERLAAMRTPDAELDLWEDPDEWVADGAEIALDGPAGPVRRLRAHATPGHTRGHVVFADTDGGLLFAGDHVLPRITPSIGFEPAPARNPLADYLDSLHLVRKMPDAALLPAHGPVGRRVHERVDELLDHHGHRLDATLAAVRAGRTTAHAVAGVLLWTRRERRLADLDPFNAMLAVLETGAHLDVLVARGALRETVENGIARYRM